MDSVPQGGNFDGLAGVVAGFLLLVNLKEKKNQNLITCQSISIKR
jgi:hypothetical protein